MIRTLTCLLFSLLILLTGCATPSPAGGQLEGRVVGVRDGDSLTLLDAGNVQHKIRLDGIDAPERGQPFGSRAKQSLSDLAFGRDAQAHCPKVDRYDRRVCKVLVGGVDVGLEQIKRGMAWHFKRYENEQSPEDRVAYATAEVQAREAGRGLWRDLHPVPPWEWRKSRR